MARAKRGLGKWLQRLFYNRVSEYFDYDETRAGYFLSCGHQTALLSDFVMNRDDEAWFLAVYAIISKAFDSVSLDEFVECVWESEMPSV